MRLIGNLLWLVFGGLIAGMSYVVAGCALCLTIIGLPFGWRALQFGWMVMLPFGKAVAPKRSQTGCVSQLFNLLWVVAAGWPIALTHLLFAIILLPTVIGIPFALRHLKLLPLAPFPFCFRLGKVVCE